MKRQAHGPGLPPASGQGIGLQNTRERVTRLFVTSGSVEVGGLDDGTVAVLRFPFTPCEGAATPPFMP